VSSRARRSGQIVEYGRPVAEVAERLGVSIHSLYSWKRQQSKGDVGRRVEQDENAKCAGSLKSGTC